MSIVVVPMIAALETDWIPSIDDMDAAIAELRTKVLEFTAATADAEVAVGGDVTAWRAAWTTYVADLEDFEGELWFNRWQRRARIIAFRERFNALVGWFRRLPGAAGVADRTPTYSEDQTSPDRGGPFGDVSATVKWAAIGIVGIAALVAVGHLSGLLKLSGLDSKKGTP